MRIKSGGETMEMKGYEGQDRCIFRLSETRDVKTKPSMWKNCHICYSQMETRLQRKQDTVKNIQNNVEETQDYVDYNLWDTVEVLGVLWGVEWSNVVLEVCRDDKSDWRSVALECESSYAAMKRFIKRDYGVMVVRL